MTVVFAGVVISATFTQPLREEVMRRRLYLGAFVGAIGALVAAAPKGQEPDPLERRGDDRVPPLGPSFLNEPVLRRHREKFPKNKMKWKDPHAHKKIRTRSVPSGRRR